MAVTPQGIEARVRSLAEDFTSRLGFELVDVEYRREPAGWTLRLFIDKDGGVGLQDCEQVSREFGTVLEVEDPIPNHFNLEVSSPGLDRPLKKDGDFLAAQGKLIRIVTRQPISGQRNFKGRLLWAGPAEGALGLRLQEEAGAEHEILASEIEKARLIYEWPAPASRGAQKQGRKPGGAGDTGWSGRTGKKQ